jgi:hypothetical protein
MDSGTAGITGRSEKGAAISDGDDIATIFDFIDFDEDRKR